MPLVKEKGKVLYHMRWTKEWNDQLLKVGDAYKRGRKTIDWRAAEFDGALDGLPSMSLNELSRRYSFLKRMLDPKFRTHRKKLMKNYNKKYKAPKPTTAKRRREIIRREAKEATQSTGLFEYEVLKFRSPRGRGVTKAIQNILKKKVTTIQVRANNKKSLEDQGTQKSKKTIQRLESRIDRLERMVRELLEIQNRSVGYLDLKKFG